MTYVNRTNNNTQGLSALSTISGRQEDLLSTNGFLDVNIAGDIVVGDINLTKVGGSAISLGQATMSASLPVAIASDQSSLSINNISGTVSLPTGAATSSNQTNGTQQTKITDGTNVTSVIPPSGINTVGNALTIGSEFNVLKDEFSGSVLNASNWTVTQKPGTSTTYSVANSLLTINAQTAANDYIAFTSTQTYTLPFRVQVIMGSISQRIANNNLYIEVVNSSGTTVTALAATGVTTGTTQVAYLANGTTATTGSVVAQNQGVKATADAAVTIATTAAGMAFELECRADTVDFGTRTVDVASASTANSQMRSRTTLDPTEQYYIQIRSLNGGSNPATNTAFNIESVLIQQMSRNVVEVQGGRGNNAADRTIPVVVPGTVATSQSALAVTTGTITTNASAVTTGSLTGGGFAQISTHGTYAGISFGVTVSDDAGTTFYSVPIYDESAQAWLSPGTMITPGTNASKRYWVAQVPSASQIKVLSSAYTSGTANIRIIPGYTALPGSSMSQIMDAAGNNRGVNVDVSNRMTIDNTSWLGSTAPTVGSKTSANSVPVVIASDQSSIPVSATITANPLVSSPLVGQAKIAVTGTAVRLNGGTSQALTNGIIISAPSGNADPILIGGSGVTNTADGTGNGYALAPGASISFAVTNTNVLYINGNSGDYISWAGS